MTEFEVLAWSSIASAVVGALVGGLVGHKLTVAHQRTQSREIRRQHLAALLAEIDYCAQLAGTYVEEEYKVPLYRFPRTVYDTVYPTLVSEILSADDVRSLITFYSQVDQMNRGLEAADRYRALGDQPLLDAEVGRLRNKALEMRHPGRTLKADRMHDFYAGAAAAVKRHLAV